MGSRTELTLGENGKKKFTTVLDRSNVSINYLFDNFNYVAPPVQRSLKVNNSDPTLVTEIYFRYTNQDNLNISDILSTIGTGDVILLQSSADATKSYVYNITGAVTDQGTYYKMIVTYSQTGLGGNFALQESVGVLFVKNVNTAGFTKNTDTDVSSNGWVLDEDDMASNDPTKVPTQQSVKQYVDNNVPSTIKLAAWEFKSYNDKDGVTYQNDGGSASDGSAKITEMIAGAYIPSGYRATAYTVYASSPIAVEIFENQLDDVTAVSKGTGNANTQVNMTNVNSTSTNYLSITLVELGQDIYGASIEIEKIP